MRVLTTIGHAQYLLWLSTLRQADTLDVPKSLLSEDNATSELLLGDLDLKETKFTSKYEFAKHISSVVLKLRTANTPSGMWPRIWDSLALFYFDSICPIKNGKWAPYRSEFYSYKMKGPKGPLLYRHRVYGPCTLYMVSPEAVQPFFANVPPSRHGDYEENVGSRMFLGSRPEVLLLLRELYVSSDNQIKRGYTTKKQYYIGTKKPFTKSGSIHRIATVCKQLGKNYDLFGLPIEELKALLPEKEFTPWLRKK